MTKKPLNTSFKLTQPELLFLLRLLELPDLPGMGEKPWGELSVEQAEEHFRQAGLALQARGLVGVNDQQQPTADRGLIQALQCAAYPERMSSAAWRSASGDVAQVHHYRRDQAHVRQHSLDGTHAFDLLDGSDMGLADMLALFESDHWQMPVGRVAVLPAAVYEQAADLALKNPGKAEALLTEAGLAAEVAGALAGVFARGRRRANLRWVYQFAPERQMSAVTVWTSPESGWVVETDDPSGSGQVRILGVDGPALRRLLTAAQAPLLAGSMQ